MIFFLCLGFSGCYILIKKHDFLLADSLFVTTHAVVATSMNFYISMALNISLAFWEYAFVGMRSMHVKP